MRPKRTLPARGHGSGSMQRVANSAGYVYFIQPANGGLIKIGWALDPETRRAELQIGSPAVLNIIGTIEGDQMLERELHVRFKHLREHGEWFRPHAEIKTFMDENLAGRRMDRDPAARVMPGSLGEGCEVCSNPRVSPVPSRAPGRRCEACEEVRILREHGIDPNNPTLEQEDQINQLLAERRRGRRRLARS